MRHPLLPTFLLCALIAPGCDGCDAPCSTDLDCELGQRCVEGRCEAPSALPSDAGEVRDDAGQRPEDAGRSGAGGPSVDGGPLDSGWPDAGGQDAGPSQADAGVGDAGAAPTDAGDRSCLSSRECADTARLCAELRDEGSAVTPYCVAPSSGSGALGDACAASSGCSSGLCVPRAQTCSEACTDAALDCGGGQACTAYPFGTETGAFTFVGVCVNACNNDAACPGGRVCTYNGNPLTNVFDAICEVPLGAGLLGASCAGDADCESGLCLSEGCSRVCATSADCASGAPGSLMTTCSDVQVAAPVGTGDTTLRLCRAP